MNQNLSDNTDDNLTLENTLISKKLTIEEKFVLRSILLEAICILNDEPIEMMCFMARHIKLSTENMIFMLNSMSHTELFSKISFYFALKYDIPEITNLIPSYSESDLTYIGKRSLTKRYEIARSESNAKVKKYILKHKND